jgi:hypothetical protein
MSAFLHHARRILLELIRSPETLHYAEEIRRIRAEYPPHPLTRPTHRV